MHRAQGLIGVLRMRGVQHTRLLVPCRPVGAITCPACVVAASDAPCPCPARRQRIAQQVFDLRVSRCACPAGGQPLVSAHSRGRCAAGTISCRGWPSPHALGFPVALSVVDRAGSLTPARVVSEHARPARLLTIAALRSSSSCHQARVQSAVEWPARHTQRRPCTILLRAAMIASACWRAKHRCRRFWAR